MNSPAAVEKRSNLQVEALAERVRAALPREALVERRMFGGIGFMLNGNMMAASSRNGLLLRVGKENHFCAMQHPGTKPMEMRGRWLKGYLYVDPDQIDDEGLRGWLQLALAYINTLPAKG